MIRLGVFWGLFMAVTAFAYGDGDWQLWITGDMEGKPSEKWKVKVEEEFRYGSNLKEFYYQHTDCGLTRKLTDWFNLGLNYRQIYEKKEGVWQQENRPHINGTFKWKWLDFEFEDRNRFEYRIREGKKSSWRYRNRLALGFPVKLTKLDIQPYLADEIFVDFDEGELNRNRFYVGFKAKLIKYLKADIFYLHQMSKKSGDWTQYNVIGAKLKAEF